MPKAVNHKVQIWVYQSFSLWTHFTWPTPLVSDCVLWHAKAWIALLLCRSDSGFLQQDVSWIVFLHAERKNEHESHCKGVILLQVFVKCLDYANLHFTVKMSNCWFTGSFTWSKLAHFENT